VNTQKRLFVASNTNRDRLLCLLGNRAYWITGNWQLATGLSSATSREIKQTNRPHIHRFVRTHNRVQAVLGKKRRVSAQAEGIDVQSGGPGV
jgi:hypothetical protein